MMTVAVALSGVALQAHAQDGSVDTVSNAGVVRASALVDSVFIDRLLPEARIDPGDFASYLMARLNIRPLPQGMGLRVTVDTARIALTGRVGDLPPEAARALGPLLGMFGPDTEYGGSIELDKVAREVVRFRLAGVTVNGVAIPEPVVGAVMLDVGKQYPALSRTGRELYVEIPADAEIVLVPGGVRLIAPPADSTPSPIR